MDTLSFRAAQLPELANLCYLDHAYRGPVTQGARLAVDSAMADAQRGRLALAGQVASVEAARSGVASLLGCAAEHVCWTANTTAAIGAVAFGVDWRPGDRVLVHDDEVPGCVLPWQSLAKRGVVVESLPSRCGRLDLEDLAEVCRLRPPRWICVALVALGTGQRRDLAQIISIAHSVGARVCVDVAQALGSIDVTSALRGADAVAGCGRKWLCGPPEVGFLALSSVVSEELAVVSAGGGSVGSSGARRWEGGALAAIPLAGLGASLALLRRLGSPRVFEEVVLERSRELATRGAEVGWAALYPKAPHEQAGVVHFELPTAPENLESRLEGRGVVVRVQGCRLRASPHVWTESADLERLIQTVEEERSV
jgi:cysteine desulfurase/selenocysteine lyase